MKIVKGDERVRFPSQSGWSALFSDDELYRFSLERPVEYETDDEGDYCGELKPADPPTRLVSCGLNPSTADAFRNDATVRKELGFARRWGCLTYVKVNAYAWRDTKPDNRWKAHRAGRDIVGTGDGFLGIDNNNAIRNALTMLKSDGGIALAAWGNHVDSSRALKLLKIADEVGVEWMCLGVNKDGSPKHSLYPPYDTALRPWRTA